MKRSIFNSLASFLLLTMTVISCSNGSNRATKTSSKEECTITSESGNSLDDVIGTWKGSCDIYGITMHEMLVFKKDGSGVYKVNNDPLPFTWKMKDSSTIEAQTSEGEQIFKIVNGYITDVSANGSYGTTFYKK